MTADLHRRVGLSELQAWAEFSGDRNRLHTDAEYAATTRFEVPIAHGHLALAWLVEWALLHHGARWLTGGELADIRFRAPVLADQDYVVAGSVQPDGSTNVTISRSAGDPPAVTSTLRLRPKEQA